MVSVEGLLAPDLDSVLSFPHVGRPLEDDQAQEFVGTEGVASRDDPNVIFFFLIKKHQNELELGKTSVEKPVWLGAQFTWMGWN